ncbi:hypothetical protein EUTSA_v10015760mg, partial [Eutrema salsugineum]
CLTLIRDIIKGTSEFDRIRQSCFGPLFDLPAFRCPVSCKLIHTLLTRQLMTKKQYELWIVFGGHPFHFSLQEFCTVTGLPAGEYPEDYVPDNNTSSNKKLDDTWLELIGDDPGTSLADIAKLLKEKTDMSSGKKLRLALLLIVDGVFIANTQVHRPTPKYVRMLTDVNGILSFPWGRESFLKTISCMRPAKKSNTSNKDPVASFRQQMRQCSFRLVEARDQIRCQNEKIKDLKGSLKPFTQKIKTGSFAESSDSFADMFEQIAQEKKKLELKATTLRNRESWLR